MTNPGFTLSVRHQVPALGVCLETWRHPCGAVHHHLACQDEHRAFVVGFRTIPEDSSGLPHILEHTTLCGSQRYPVRDPFMAMLRRSLQTYMNAMTLPDMTCYPFASQVAKDYDNLLRVYLDAVFRPLLDPLDFAQEGHRLEAHGDGWRRTGVVYNEMKGAIDGTAEQMGMATARALLPDTCYRFNFGGEPRDIPNLKYSDLVAFHRRCYCPANACFVTYGDQAATEVHAQLEAYLTGDPGQALQPPSPQPPLNSPTVVEVPVPLGADQDVEDVSAASVTWAWSDTAQLDEILDGELLDRLLLGHAGAPLRLALEQSGLGRSAGGSGYAASSRTGFFSAELSGMALEDYPKLETLVTTTLTRLVQDGWPPKEVAAALDQLELARREIHGDTYPYGLELCFRLLQPWNYGVDPLPFLDQAAAIVRLRTRASTPGWLVGEVRRRFLENPHRVLVLAKPDHDFHARQRSEEAADVVALIERLDAGELARLHEEAAALTRRQHQHDDPEVLPDLELADVPGERRFAEGRDIEEGVTVFTPGTNGLLHQVVALQLPDLNDDELDLLPLLTQTFGNMGLGDMGYAQRAAHLNANCGGLWAWSDLSADVDDLTRIRGVLFCEVKGLASSHSRFAGLISETLFAPRFDESQRLRELIEQALQRLQDRVQGSGNTFAARAATRGFAGAASLGHRMGGLGRLAWLKRAALGFQSQGGDRILADLGSRLAKLQLRLAGQPRSIAVIGDSAQRSDVLVSLKMAWSGHVPAHAGPATSLREIASTVSPATAYTTATAVSYCALAFPTVPFGHADSAALAVAGRLLTNNVLHPRIREQGGAYGAQASYASSSGAFTITSYRDPRLSATFEDMRAALQWLGDCPADARLLKEAILGVIAGLDAPGSPAGEARARFTGDCKGIGPQRLNALRRRVLSTTIEDVRRIARVWLPADGGTAAAVTSPEIFLASALPWAAEAI